VRDGKLDEQQRTRGGLLGLELLRAQLGLPSLRERRHLEAEVRLQTIPKPPNP